MFVGESLRMAASSLWAHRMRSVLTILGVILGIGAVLAVVTIGASFERSIVSGFNTVDDRTIFVTCDMAHPSVVGGPPDCHGLGRIFSERDRQVILGMDGIEAANPQGRLPIDHLSMGNRSIPFTSIAASESDSTAISSLAGGFESGRVFAPGAPEVVVSHDVGLLLGGNGTLVEPGTPLTIHFLDGTSDDVTVVGVLKRETNQFVQFTTGTIYAPVDRYYRFPPQPSPVTGQSTQMYDGFSVVADAPAHLQSAKAEVTQYLDSPASDAYHLQAEGTTVYIATGSTIVDSVSTIFTDVTLLISAIAVVSLLVGAIGIANIMLVAVTERTREIGVLKAVGAKDSQVLLLFLLEAMLVGLVGAVLGVVLGLAAGATIVKVLFHHFTIVVPIPWVGIALGVGLVTGIVAGMLPARRATKIQPVAALAYE